MSLDGVKITKGQPGANTLLGADSTSGLIANGVAVTDKAQLETVYTLYQPKDAVNIGIDADYDETNSVNVYRHIVEFYRRCGNGVKLFVMLVGQDVSMSDMLEDADVEYAKKLIVGANGEIKQLAVALNPASNYVATYTDGLDSDVRAAIPLAQAFHDWTWETHRPCRVILEGRDYHAATAAAALDLLNIEDTPAGAVTLIIGQDYDYAETLWALGKKFADVGAFLGDVAAIRVNQNPGEIGTRNLTDATKSAFLTGGLSNHTEIKAQEADWATLDGKGYVFPVYYQGAAGLRWNNGHVCLAEAVDENGVLNESTIARGRTLDKAARALRAALLPKVKSVQPVDPATGLLPPGIIKYFEGIGDRAFERMKPLEISEGKTIVDPTSDLLTDKALKVSFFIVPYGDIGKIDGTTYLKKTL